MRRNKMKVTVVAAEVGERSFSLLLENGDDVTLWSFFEKEIETMRNREAVLLKPSS